MAQGKFVSYLRVSTQKQGLSGLGLEAQREVVTAYLNANHGALAREVIEIESGKRGDRPKLKQALQFCKRARATLVIAKLDRLARDVEFIAKLMKSGIEFRAVDMPQANKLTIHIMAAMAEYEAEAISTRTKEALKAARARGVKLGGLRHSPQRFQEIAAQARQRAAVVNREKRREHHRQMLPVIEEIKATGRTSLRAIADELNARGEQTRRGKQWSPAQVRRVLLLTPALAHA